jgi:hypothetical protein
MGGKENAEHIVMNSGMALLFIVLTLAASVLLTNATVRAIAIPGRISWSLTWFAIFFTSLLVPFLLLGYIQLIFRVPAVRIQNATVISALLNLPALWLYGYSCKHFRKPSEKSSFAISNDATTRMLTWTAIGIFILVGIMVSSGYPQGYEPSAYHLPLAVHTFQANSLLPWDARFQHALPANASLYYGLMLQLMPEKWVSASSLFFLLPLAGAVYGTARSIGADFNASVVVAIGTIGVPLVALGSVEAGADVPGLAFLACGLYFVFAEAAPVKWRMTFAGICVGLAVGCKNLHLASMAIISGLLIGQSFSRDSTQVARRFFVEYGSRVVPFALAAMIISSFWLVRSWVVFNNPVYPVYISGIFDLLGWEKAPDLELYDRAYTQYEWVRRPLEWIVYPWHEWNSIGKNFSSNSGLGPFFAAAVPVAVFAVALRSLGRGTRVPRSPTLLLLGGCLSISVWWVMGDRQPRYAMGALAYLMPVTGWVMSQLTGVFRRIQELVLKTTALYALLVFFTMQLTAFGDRILYSGQTSQARFYEYPAAIDELSPGSTIVNLGSRTWNYPLFGATFQNRVISYNESLIAVANIPPMANHPVTGDDLPTIPIVAHELRSLGATHLFTTGQPHFAFSGCVSLTEVDRVDRNPVNNVRLSSPRLLYKIHYCG